MHKRPALYKCLILSQLLLWQMAAFTASLDATILDFPLIQVGYQLQIRFEVWATGVLAFCCGLTTV